jgi:hypothetical protein
VETAPGQIAQAAYGEEAMPTISRSDAMFGGVRYTRTVNFSNKTRLFSVAIPKECTDILGYDRISDATLDGLEKKYHDESQKLLDAKAKTRKVILYKVLMNCAHDDLPKCDAFEKLGYNHDGIGVQVIAGVYLEKKFSFQGDRQNTIYELVESSIPKLISEDGIYDWNHDKSRILDWTPEREEFFRTFGDAMSKLCRMVSKFFGDEKELLALIENGARILPPPESNGTDRNGDAC